MGEHFLLSFVVFLMLGAVTGVLSGMFGIGGGILIVPCLVWLFSWYHLASSNMMQMAVGTSLAVMVVSTARALLAHRQYHIEFWTVYRRWIIPLIIGVFGGVLLAHHLQSNVLGIIFGVFLIAIALKMLIALPTNSGRYLPGKMWMSFYGVVIGIMSGLLGVGGGTLVIPYLTHYNVAMRRAVVISIAVGMTVASVGALLMIVTSWHQPGLPLHSWGYVYWPAWLGMSIGSLFSVPLGAALSHQLSVTVLRRILVVLLVLIGMHFLLQ